MAEDAVQDAFWQLWRDASRFDPALGSARSWFLGIVRHRCIDSGRRLQVYRSHTEPDGDLSMVALASTGEEPHELVWRRDLASLLSDALVTLPEAQREVIDLGFYQGLSHSEIGTRLDIPLGTVKSRSRLALAHVSRRSAICAVV